MLSAHIYSIAITHVNCYAHTPRGSEEDRKRPSATGTPLRQLISDWTALTLFDDAPMTSPRTLVLSLLPERVFGITHWDICNLSNCFSIRNIILLKKPLAKKSSPQMVADQKWWRPFLWPWIVANIGGAIHGYKKGRHNFWSATIWGELFSAEGFFNRIFMRWFCGFLQQSW